MRTLLALALLATSLLAGCTSTSGDEYVTPTMDDEGRYVIKMLPSNKFSPENAAVPVGATVVWVNEGGGHNVKSDDGAFQSTVSSDKGEHFEFTFDAAGTFDYHCQPHQSLGMIGSIRVE